MRIRHFELVEKTSRPNDITIWLTYVMTNENGKILGNVDVAQRKDNALCYFIVSKVVKGDGSYRTLTNEEERQFKQFLFNEFATEEQRNFDPLA